MGPLNISQYTVENNKYMEWIQAVHCLQTLPYTLTEVKADPVRSVGSDQDTDAGMGFMELGKRQIDGIG